MQKSGLSLSLVLVLTACPADDSGDDGNDTGADDGTVSTTATTTATTTAGTTMTSTTATTTASTTDADSGSSEDGATTEGGSESAGGAPVIEMVVWTQAEGCTMGTGSNVDIVITVSDPDDDPSTLTFEGMALGCTGMIDAAEVTILCPQVAPYGTSVTVTDPGGNSDDIDFMIAPCADGMAP